MYGINGFYDEDVLQQLLGLSPEVSQGFQAQDTPQFAQGLLGDIGGEQQNIKDLISKGTAAAGQLGQNAQSPAQSSGAALLAQRMGQAQQAGNQMLQQQQQQEQQREQQQGNMLMKLAMMFLGG